MKINIVEWFAVQELWEPFFVVAQSGFSLLKSKSCLRFRQKYIHLYWTRERATLCTKCWSYLNTFVWVLYLSKISNVKNETFSVLSSLCALWCDANANSWQILKLTRKKTHTAHQIVDEMLIFRGRERQTLDNKHTAIPYDTMRYMYLGCVSCRCVWIKSKMESSVYETRISSTYSAKKKTFTKRETAPQCWRPSFSNME